MRTISPMKLSIAVSKEKIDNEVLEKIMVSGASCHDEALEAAKEWCDKNNCILESREFENPIRQMEDTSRFFYAKAATGNRPSSIISLHAICATLSLMVGISNGRSPHWLWVSIFVLLLLACRFAT